MDAEQRVWLAGAAQERPIRWRVSTRMDLVLLYLIVFLVASVLSAAGAGTTKQPDASPLVWLPLAWTIGVCYISPRKLAWSIVGASTAGIFLGYYIIYGPGAASAATFGYALELVPAVLVMRLYFDSRQTSALIQFGIFMLVLVVLAPFTGGLICSAVYGIVMGSPMEAVLSSVLNQGVASSVAVIAMMPVFISRAAWNVLMERRIEAAAIVAMTAASTYLVFINDSVWLMVIPAMLATLASLRFGLVGTGATCTILVLISTWQTAHGQGPLAVLADGPLEGLEFVIVQFLNFVLCFLAGLIGSQVEDAERRTMGLQAYGDAVMGTTEGIVVLDTTGKIILANPAVSKITGNAADELIGRRVSEFGDGVDEIALQTRDKMLQGEEIYQVPVNIRRKDGSDIDIVFNATPLINGDQLVGAVMVLRDTTEREQLQKEVVETAAMTRTLVQSVDDSVIGIDKGGLINHWNNAATEQFGLEAEEILGMHFTNLPGPPADERMERFQFVLNGGRIKGHTIYVPDRKGGTRELEVTINPVIDDNGDVIGTASVSRDVTEIRKAKKSAEENRDALYDAMGSIEDGIAFFDAEDRLVVCNDAFTRKFASFFDTNTEGLTHRDMLDKMVAADAFDLGEQTPHSWTSIHLAKREQERKNPSGGVTSEARLKDGSWYLATNYGRRDQGSILIVRDITSLKRRELELRESNRDLEQFAHVASHDLKEPLRKIQTFGSILKTDYADELEKDAQQIVDFMVDGADRLERLIDDLLEFSSVSQRDTPLESVDLRESLDAVCASLSDGIAEAGADVTYDMLPSVMGRNSAIDRVFGNLIANSLKYRHKQRPLKIDISEVAAPAGWATIRFSDNGVGFDPANAENIFAPFVRVNTDPEISGTGMGLAIIRKIVHGFGGRIEARGHPGEGASFLVTLRRPSARYEEANENDEYPAAEDSLRRG